MNNDWNRLLKNVVALLIIAGAGVTIYYLFFRPKDEHLVIEDTPLQVESIRTIAEISTVSYKDEVVMDTIEYYDNSHSIFDPRKWYKDYYKNIKRRLTLIVKGEVRYGVDITNANYSTKSNQDTLWLSLPRAKMLDVIVSPSQTEVFQEQGEWNDSARRNMEAEAKLRIKDSARQLNLADKAEENAGRLFKKLVQTKKVLIIDFEYE